jgi:hypothetical protein
MTAGAIISAGAAATGIRTRVEIGTGIANTTTGNATIMMDMRKRAEPISVIAIITINIINVIIPASGFLSRSN